MKTIRNKAESLETMLNELKIGDESILDAVSGYVITRVPGGYIYRNDYSGLVFVPKPEKNIVTKEPKVVTK